LAFYFTAKGKGWRQVGRLLWRLNMFFTSCDIHPEAEIGPGLFLPHPTGIVIGECRIGKNASILQNVTVGSLRKRILAFPTIGDDVEIWAGAVVVGDIAIGDRVAIGANAVVLEDIPSDSVAVGVPARFKPRAKRG
jgi:serine O-acetyltransferase